MAPPKVSRHYPPEYVSAETLAYLMDCSVETVEGWVRSGILPAPRRLGRLARWRLADVDAAIGGRDGLPVVADNGVLSSGDDPFLAGVKSLTAK